MQLERVGDDYCCCWAEELEQNQRGCLRSDEFTELFSEGGEFERCSSDLKSRANPD